MDDDTLLFATAARTAALIRRRGLSPIEFMQAVLARARDIQARLNPFAVLLEERAMAEARGTERRPADGRPLHGVPVTIKDQVDVGGVATIHGSAIHAGAVDPMPASKNGMGPSRFVVVRACEGRRTAVARHAVSAVGETEDGGAFLVLPGERTIVVDAGLDLVMQ